MHVRGQLGGHSSGKVSAVVAPMGYVVAPMGYVVAPMGAVVASGPHRCLLFTDTPKIADLGVEPTKVDEVILVMQWMTCRQTRHWYSLS